jgi:hypothetical protein
MAITATVNRVGPGWGASGGLAGVYVAGVDNPTRLNGHQEGDWDFNLALGANWGKAAKATSKANKMQPLIRALMKIGKRTPSGFKRALQGSPDNYAELLKACRSLNETLGVDASEPKVIMFDLPFTGVGVEASAFFGVANFNAVWDNL